MFPEGEVPPKIDGLTGGCEGVGIPADQFKRLTEIPLLLIFGDYIPETVSKSLGDENWRVRLQMAREFVKVVNAHGGNATLIELPKLGIHGNSHFMMEELNNDEIADIVDRWLIKEHLD